MDFLRTSIVRKVVLLSLVVGVVCGAIAWFQPTLFGPSTGAILIAVTTVGCITLFWIGLARPLKIVFREMKALLVGKPYKKIFTERIDEVGVLAHFFNEVTRNMERISAGVEEGKRMSKELSVGSDIQRKILPTTMPKVTGLALFANTRPASEVGGDSYDVIPSPHDNTYVYVGDVTGHGLPAGLIMVMVNTLIRTLSETLSSGYDILVNTNRILKQRIEQRRFMTAVLLRWNSAEKKLFYTGCGHEHILIYHRKERTCEVRQTGGIALGMVPDISKIIKEEQIPFEQGDLVVLYSDGIVEARNTSGEMYGVPRLQKAVEAFGSTSTAEELFTNISKEFTLFVGEQTQADDITLIVVQRID